MTGHQFLTLLARVPGKFIPIALFTLMVGGTINILLLQFVLWPRHSIPLVDIWVVFIVFYQTWCFFKGFFEAARGE